MLHGSLIQSDNGNKNIHVNNYISFTQYPPILNCYVDIIGDMVLAYQVLRFAGIGVSSWDAVSSWDDVSSYWFTWSISGFIDYKTDSHVYGFFKGL